METLCAFLNGEGGTVLFGVTDKGKIMGQEVADTTKRSIAEAINRLEREEHLAIPYKAIREGVVNSLCHRIYRTAGGSVGIAVYDDRVEIENPGTFPHNWDMEKMKSEHCSEPQNPLIANVLYKRKLLENWGRGISLMTEACKKASLPEPEYRLGGGFVVLVFRFAEFAPTNTPQVPHKHPTSTPQAESLIGLIDENMYSVKEMMELTQLKDRKNFLTNYLDPSIDAGWVETLYPQQPKHPKQKYRLTEKGQKGHPYKR